jgi:hypothetical protein
VLTDSAVLDHSVFKVIFEILFRLRLSFKRFHVGRKGRFGKRVLLYVSMSGNVWQCLAMSGNVPVVGLSLQEIQEVGCAGTCA